MTSARPRSRAALDRAAAALAPANGDLDAWYADYVRHSSERLSVDVDIISALDPERQARLLDVGAAPPLLLAALASEGWHPTGVDIDPGRFAPAARLLGLEVTRCNVEESPLPFPEGAFDLVVMNEIFEHLRIDLIRTMTEISRVLAPGGVLCMSTPNARSARGIVNFLVHGRSGWCGASDVYAQYEKLHTLGHMGHVREYTVNDIQAFLAHMHLVLEAVVWRHRDRRRPYRMAAAVFPSLSPFMSLVLRKV